MKINQKIMCMNLVIALMMLCSCMAEAFAQVQIGLSGSRNQSQVILEKYTEASATASISVMLGPFFSLGVAGSRSTRLQGGHRIIEGAPLPIDIHQTTLSTEGFATITLYRGIVSPFLLGGIARRVDKVYRKIGDDAETLTPQPQVTPTYGFGVSIGLGNRFQLKISQRYTKIEAYEFQSDPNTGEPTIGKVNVLDDKTTVGISYQI